MRRRLLRSVAIASVRVADRPAGACSRRRRALAQAPTPTDDEVNRIAQQLYCPVCENTPLDVCPTEACRQWRDLIRQQLSEGWTEEQIQQYFVRAVRRTRPGRAAAYRPELADLRAAAAHHPGRRDPADPDLPQLEGASLLDAGRTGRRRSVIGCTAR